MIDRILEFLTKKRINVNCSFCKKRFETRQWKSYHKSLGFVNVLSNYCSKECEKAMDEAIRKCFNAEKLTKQEKKATKGLCYVDI